MTDLYGPVERRRYDGRILTISNLIHRLQDHSYRVKGETFAAQKNEVFH